MMMMTAAVMVVTMMKTKGRSQRFDLFPATKRHVSDLAEDEQQAAHPV